MKIYKEVIKNEMAKILVVDDDLDMCEIMSDILKEEGYSVNSSYNGGRCFDEN